MLIGKVAKKFNIGIETLRYYDKIGLLTVAKKNNQRFYSQKDIDKLQSIIAMKKLLFSLEDIKRILDIDERIDEGLNSNSICQVKSKFVCKFTRLFKQVFKPPEQSVYAAKAVDNEYMAC